jgi:phosphoheptose isomerase
VRLPTLTKDKNRNFSDTVIPAGVVEGRIRKSIEASIYIRRSLLNDVDLVATIGKVVEILIKAFRSGNKVLLFGNGGSAADAQHIAAEFVGRFAFDRPALPALALSVNTSCVTALGNDYGFDFVFSRQMEALAQRGDVAIGISTSSPSDGNCGKNEFKYYWHDRVKAKQVERSCTVLYLCAFHCNPSHSRMSYPHRSHHFRVGGGSDIPCIKLFSWTVMG